MMLLNRSSLPLVGSILFILIKFGHLSPTTTTSPELPISDGKNDLDNAQRLRNMFQASYNSAKESLSSLSSEKSHLNQSSDPISKGNFSLDKAIRKENNTTEENDETTIQPTTKQNNHGDNAKTSGARQSSLFSGFPYRPTNPNQFGSTPFGSNQFGSNPFGSNSFGSNPLMGGSLRPLSLPNLPALPTFPAYQPPVPRPPKTSVIGNNGGPMALTNDNVVVVNVFSGNF